MTTTTNHLLIVNPSDVALRLVRAGVETKTGDKFNITVAITPEYQRPMPNKEVFAAENNATLVDLRFEEWDLSQTFVSAIAYDFAGQSFLENIQVQLLLNNVESSTNRLDKFYKSKPGPGDFLIESLSYNGRHAIVQCLKFSNKVEIENNFDQAWDELTETLYEYLDSLEVVNGPSQVYFNADKQPIGLRLHTSNIAYLDQLKATQRHWWDIWPSVALLQKDKPNMALRKFYEWYARTGSTAKNYGAGSEGQLTL